MNAPSSTNSVENLIGEVYAIGHTRKETARDRLIRFLAKAGENFSDARSHWAMKFREYNRTASENSDEWAESHLLLISSIGAGLGLMLGVFCALP